MKLIFLLFLLFNITGLISKPVPWPLLKANTNVTDSASLQRGARDFMNYCAGCHSLSAVNYLEMANRIGLKNADGEVYTDLLQQNLVFSNAPITQAIQASLTMQQAQTWFGITPADLSTIGIARGPNWLYTYLNSFYAQPNQPWGTNNLLVPGTNMPNVLLNLQGEQTPIYQQDGSHTISHLQISKPGQMTQEQFQQLTRDTVNFLVVIATPPRYHRLELGFWLLLALALLLLAAYLWCQFRR